MDNLHLVDEDGYLVRAAMLFFYKDPEKWVTGSYIKIGCFGKSDSDLLYQDEIHGPLIEEVDKTVGLNLGAEVLRKSEKHVRCMMDHCQNMKLMRLELWFYARLVISIWSC